MRVTGVVRLAASKLVIRCKRVAVVSSTACPWVENRSSRLTPRPQVSPRPVPDRPSPPGVHRSATSVHPAVECGFITADEGAITDGTAVAGEKPGPGNANPGYSALLNQPIAALHGATYYQLLGMKTLTPGQAPTAGTLPGGGRTGALLLNSRWISPGSTDATPYNHYSALRSYEDLLGITRGGSDGLGHLGMAGAADLAPFGPDVFNARPDSHRRPDNRHDY